MNADAKNKRWVKIIALYALLWIIINTGFYIYFLNPQSVIEEQLTLADHIDYFINTSAYIIIFIGLWIVASWGWKVSVIFIPLSFVYGIIHLYVDYEWGLGLFLAAFIMIDAFILRFLFTPDIKRLFQLPIEAWKKLEWTVSMAFILAAFVFAYDLVNQMVAITLTLSLFFGFRIAKKYKKKLSTKETKSI